jgi:amidophosphoribosyltransferase
MSDETPFDDDRLHEECGVFGVYNHQDAATLTALGLHALQHRGQEAAGIVTFNGSHFITERRLGLVGDKFTRPDVIARLLGRCAIGHVRYATSGDTVNRNIQPLYADLSTGGVAVAHNGNLTNGSHLRSELVKQGAIFQSTTDTESILHLIARSDDSLTIHERVIHALKQTQGAYSLLSLSQQGLIGIRDPYGVRPLVLGKLLNSDNKECYILASETCALDIIGADYVRDVQPGEMILIDENGVRSLFPFKKVSSRFCVFEYVYFARPDSMLDGLSVYETRKNIGIELAKETHIDADLVIPVPDSGNPAAMGYAKQANLDFELGIIRNHYVGRTFIEPTQQIRDLGVKLKHNANRATITGKRVILIDDSIVRGTTSRKIVEMMRQAGASEVHMRIASPPTAWSCFYGVNTPERSKLLAANMSIDEMCRFIGADSLAFLSIEGLYKAMSQEKRNSIPQYCDACFTGDYPIKLDDTYAQGISTLLSEQAN